jgi:hypothetical protein
MVRSGLKKDLLRLKELLGDGQAGKAT